MVKIKKGDFIEIDYIGKLAFNNQIFDLTDEKLAKENKLYDNKMKYGPIIICVGERNVIAGLDDELINKEIGQEIKVTLKPEQAFGKKNPKLIKTISKGAFKKQEMDPYPGMQIQLGNALAIVRNVSGGRVIVDMNHPLAGRELIYEVKIHKKVDDSKEKVSCLLRFGMMLSEKHYSLEIKEKIVEITVDRVIPEEVKNLFDDAAKKLIPEIEKVVFIEKKQKQPLENN